MNIDIDKSLICSIDIQHTSLVVTSTHHRSSISQDRQQIPWDRMKLNLGERVDQLVYRDKTSFHDTC